MGQSLTRTARTAIYNAARGTGAWGYVEPLSQTPTWVHMDRRYGTPACSGTTAGYPTLRRGSRGCYVMILQDALSTLGYQTGSRIDGVFGARTEEALRGLPAAHQSLRVDGVCGCNSWKKISTAVHGRGSYQDHHRLINPLSLASLASSPERGSSFASDGLHS